MGTSKIEKIKTNCRVCNKEFESATYEKDGVLIPLGSTCKECRNVEITKHNAESQEREKLRLIEYTNKRKQELKDKIPLKFRYTTFKNYDTKLQPAAYNAMSNYLEESIVLSSPNIWGVGKTHLVFALLNQIINELKPDQNGKIYTPFYFTTEPDLLLRIRNTYKRNNDDSETEDDIYTQINKPLLLVIDDVGKIVPSDLAFLQRVYFQIINQRYNDDRPIIITTNLDLKQLSQYIGVACADRLYEMCGKGNIVVMKGESYRQREIK